MDRIEKLTAVGLLGPTSSQRINSGVEATLLYCFGDASFLMTGIKQVFEKFKFN